MLQAPQAVSLQEALVPSQGLEAVGGHTPSCQQVPAPWARGKLLGIAVWQWGQSWPSKTTSTGGPTQPGSRPKPQITHRPPACPPPWAEPSHNSSHVISLDKPFTKGSLASAAHLRYQTCGPGCTGELGASRCHPKLPPCSPSPSLTSSSEAMAGMGFAPEPVEDGSGTERNKFSHQMQLRFPRTPIKTRLSLPRSLCCPPTWSLYPPQHH